MTLAQLTGSWPCDTRYALALEKCLQPAVSEGDEEDQRTILQTSGRRCEDANGGMRVSVTKYTKERKLEA